MSRKTTIHAYLLAGNREAETDDTPALYMAEIGRLVVSSWMDKAALEARVWLPGVWR